MFNPVSTDNEACRFYSNVRQFYYGWGEGVTTLRNAVLGQCQNCSRNLEISPGIGTIGNLCGKHAIILGHCRKNRDIGGNFISRFCLG